MKYHIILANEVIILSTPSLGSGYKCHLIKLVITAGSYSADDLNGVIKFGYLLRNSDRKLPHNLGITLIIQEYYTILAFSILFNNLDISSTLEKVLQKSTLGLGSYQVFLDKLPPLTSLLLHQ